MQADMNAFLESDMGKAFFSDGYRIAKSNIEYTDDPDRLHAAVMQLYTALEKFLELFLESSVQGGVPCACRKACAWCCHQTVYAETHEYLFLAAWLSENTDPVVKSEILELASRRKEYASALSGVEKKRFKYPCPLLRNNCCLAYEARPVSCRIYLSMDAESCFREFKLAEDESAFPSLFDLPLKVGRTLNHGFTTVLKEQGQDIREYSLENGLLKFIW